MRKFELEPPHELTIDVEQFNHLNLSLIEQSSIVKVVEWSGFLSTMHRVFLGTSNGSPEMYGITVFILLALSEPSTFNWLIQCAAHSCCRALIIVLTARTE